MIGACIAVISHKLLEMAENPGGKVQIHICEAKKEERMIPKDVKPLSSPTF